MSLDKSRTPKRGNSSRKFIPEEQRKTMTDPFVDWIKRSRSDKKGTVSGRMVEKRSQKTSEEQKELLEVEVNTDHTMNDNQEVNGLEGRGRRLASESTPVEQGHDFATSTGTLDREEMSELSDISTEVAATRRSPTDNTMMASGTGKQTTSSSFSERMKNTFGNIFPFSMGGGAGNDGESQEEEDEEEQGDFGSQVSLNSSIQESEAHVGRETGTMDKFGVVTTISKEANTPGQSKDFAIRASSEPQPGESRTRGLGNALMDPEINNEKTLKQRVKARISTSTKLPGTDRVTPPLVTPLVDNGAALEEALNNIVDSLAEQNEQMSIRMSELERAVHIERESLREEINRNRQEVGRSEKRLKERTDEHMTRNLSRMTREAEQRELRLRADMEKLRIQQEQSLGTLDTKIDAMMERRTQAIMDRLDGLLSSLLNRFGSGVQGHQAMMRFEKRRQREDETIDKFLDDLEMLRRRSQPDESNRRMNLAVASKFIDGVKNDEHRTMLATHYTPLSTNAPTPEELRLKSKEYLLLKPPSRSGYYKNNYGNFNNGPANQGNNWYKPRDDMDKRRSCANCSTTDHHVSACPAYKQGMKAIGFSLEDEDASELDHEDFMRGVIAKFGPRCFFCNLEGHFKSDCPQFWDAVADIKHPRHGEALSGVKASKARLLSEAKARRKDKPQELAAKKMQAVTEKAREPVPATAADDFKIDYKAAARDALNRVQQELVTKEIEQKVKLELENEKLQEQLNTFEATEFEETKTPSSLDMKLKVISGKRFGMVPQGNKIQSIISVAGHQVIRNLSEPSEFTLMHLDTYADYLRQVEPRTESRAVRALLTTGGPRMKKLHGRYMEVYGPYQIMLNVDGISIYTRTYITTDDDQMGQIYLGEEELKVRRIGHDAMMEQDAAHIGYEADVTAHLLDTNGTKIGVTGLLDTGAVVSVMPIKTWERMGFTREDLIPTNLRLAAAQSRSHLHSRKNTDNGPSHGRTRSLDELPGGRESGRRRPIHLGQRLCQEF